MRDVSRTKSVLLRSIGAFAAAVAIGFTAIAHADSGEAKIRINVRDGMGTDFPVVTTLSAGQKVDILEWDGEFARVRTAGGSEGYLKSKYLTNVEKDMVAEKAPMAPPAPVAPAAAVAVPVAAAPVAAPVVAAAPEVASDSAVTLNAVTVTGSRIRRKDLSSISPITILSAEDLKAAGNATLEDFLQDLPSTLGGADYGSSVNNGNPGLATAQLRGLGPNRTLILINGHRPAQASTDGIVDLNMIPTAIIERIEVLRDGSSTVYGSDAIAGVINIITKKDFEGVALDLSYDITSEGDGKQRGLAITWGAGNEKGNVMLTGQVQRREAVYQRDRAFSACPFFEDPDRGVFCGGSGTTTPAQIIPAEEDQTFVVDQTTGEVRPYDSALDSFNFAESSLMVTPQDIFSVYATSNYKILEDEMFGVIDGYFEAGYTNRESKQLLADVGTFWAPSVPASNPLNPFGDAQCANNPNCSQPQSVSIARRLEESNGRSFLQDAIGWRMVLGFNGELNNGWTWDLSHNIADWTDTQRDGGRAVRPRITGLVDPNCEANSNCTPLPAEQQAWDPFNRGTLTPAQLRYGTVAVNELNRARMNVSQFNLAGDFGDLALPGGAPAWALGFEHRSETGASLPDGGSAIDAIYSTPGNVTEGGYSVDEVYGELSLPLLSDTFLAEVLTLEASFRASDYDFVKDEEVTTKFALEWAPVNSLRLRATVAEGFRAPNLSERFLGEQTTFASYSDPCQNWDTSGNQIIIDNCGPNGDNLPAGFTVDAPQAATIEGGNPNLKPETSDSTTFGLVFTPTMLPNFSLALDFFTIKLEDAVGTAGTGNVINRCYGSVNFSDPLCALLQGPDLVDAGRSNVAPDRRNAVNQVTGILLTNQNISSFETAGLDFQIDYTHDTAIGEIAFRMTGTVIDKYTYVPIVGGDAIELAGTYGIDPYNKNAITAFPELAVNTTLGLNRNNWGGSITLRWFDETRDGDGPDCGLSCTADAGQYLDIQGYMDLGKAKLTVGARNVTDEDPPYVSNYDDMNTLHYTYDTAGAYYYARVGYEF
ncbi:MAG: TonB-dependent receptor domain-containing protein [Oceanococcus sp.]